LRRDALEEQYSQQAEKSAISTDAVDKAEVLLVLRFDVCLTVRRSSFGYVKFVTRYKSWKPFFHVNSNYLTSLVKRRILAEKSEGPTLHADVGNAPVSFLTALSEDVLDADGHSLHDVGKVIRLAYVQEYVLFRVKRRDNS
jgi:hypothetical protein